MIPTRKILFIDRDGTLIEEPADFQIDSLEKLVFLPHAISNLGKIAQQMDFELVLVSNQDGLGTPSFPEQDFWPVQNVMLRTLASEGIVFDQIHIDPSLPDENKSTRKPGLGMLQGYLNGSVDFSKSYVIGDRTSDVALAKNLGCKAIRIAKEEDSDAVLTTTMWSDIYNFLALQKRQFTVQRSTSETNVGVCINLDGNGFGQIDTGLAFFDHMLEQLVHHGGIDLQVITKGDTWVDEHHTIEDTALALGTAFRKALGKKIGIERYGFWLPMDDCEAQVSIDFGGRPWLRWEVDFSRERVGDFPLEMAEHFFKSFCDASACNLSMKATGSNDHHKIESLFKAWARSIRIAIKKSGSTIPSSKGTL